MARIELETRLNSCLQSEDADLLTVVVKLLGPDIVDPETGKRRKGEGTGTQEFRLRPLTGPEKSRAKKEAQIAAPTTSINRDGSRSVALVLNEETLNDWYLYFALGGERTLGKGESIEGWTLKDSAGDVLPVSIENIRANLHQGMKEKLVELVVGLSDISPASEKN